MPQTHLPLFLLPLFCLFPHTLPQAKVPLPNMNYTMENKYCHNTPNSSDLRGPCAPYATVGGSTSPCAYGCMAPHRTTIGDPCDPFLWLMARRKYDDNFQDMKIWMKEIIGGNFDPINADHLYQGHCTFFCPRVLCMDVYYDPAAPGDLTQFVDMHMYNCYRTDTINQYLGVCSCGHHWSYVDPASANQRFDRTDELVHYDRVDKLDRRLQWNSTSKRCEAAHYGHCSLKWDEQKYKQTLTHCYDQKEHACVNRTVNVQGQQIYPVKVKATGLWYGLCDAEIPIVDPFHDGAATAQGNKMMSGVVALLIMAQQWNIA